VVVAYGRILTEAVLRVPPRGCVNVHASLLPRYRGAAPIQWAILRGESVTGISTMQMDPGVDTGDMLLRRDVPIGPRMTSGDLHDRLATIGAQLLLETITGLKARTIVPVPQDHSAATYAPILKKEDGLIDWSRPAREVDWHVRGMTPWPSAFTFMEGRRCVILEGTPLQESLDAPPGTLVDQNPGGWLLATGEGSYRIERIKPENCKPMDAAAYQCGHPVPRGARFTSSPGVS
jgi:methionyl-tRNA formyltransferase